MHRLYLGYICSSICISEAVILNSSVCGLAAYRVGPKMLSAVNFKRFRYGARLANEQIYAE